MKKEGEETGEVINGIGLKKYLPAKQYIAGRNHMSGRFYKILGRDGIEAAKAYANEVLSTVDPEKSFYHRGRHERAAEFVKVIEEAKKPEAHEYTSDCPCDTCKAKFYAVEHSGPAR